MTAVEDKLLRFEMPPRTIPWNEFKEEMKGFKDEMKDVIREEVSRAIADHLVKFEERLEQLNSVNAKLSKENACLKKTCQSLEARVTRLETLSLKSNIEVAGIPLGGNENPTHILSIISEKLSCPLADNLILRAYRSGGQRNVNGKIVHPLIVAELRNSQIQEEFLEKVRKYWRARNWKVSIDELVGGGCKEELQIRRQLPPDLKFLLNKGKEVARTKGYRYTWITRSGRLMTKKSEETNPVIINNIEDLKKIV